jgi:DNA polymerase III delta prime subunit
MSLVADEHAAIADLKQSHRSGRLAHAYVVVGPPTTTAVSLVTNFLAPMFCEEVGRPEKCETEGQRMLARNHPDVVWMEPTSKSRIIRAEEVREVCKLVARTSYEGGWKAVLVMHADRMQEPAANVFLKTLEEPPPRSVLFLLTDAPQNLLPTILSRCQRLTLSGEADPLADEWREMALAILAGGGEGGVWGSLTYANRMKALLDEVKKAAEKEITKSGEDLGKDVHDARVSARVQAARAGVLRLVLLWRRDLMLAAAGVDAGRFNFPDHAGAIGAQAKDKSLGEMLRHLSDVEQMVLRMDRHLPPVAVFCADQLGALLRRPRA